MGQGNYSAVIYGVVTEQDLRNHPVVEAWQVFGAFEDDNNKLILRTSYECEDNWIGFMVADTDGNINTYFKPKDPIDLYPQRGLLLYRKAFSFSQLESAIAGADFKHWSAVKSAWEQFSQELYDYEECDEYPAKIKLPAPELILVNDWH